MYQKLLATLKPSASTGVRWDLWYANNTGFYMSEGSEVAVKITVANPTPGCSIRCYVTGGAASENNNNWSRSFTAMCTEEAARHTGVTYTPQGDSSHPSSRTGIFTFAADYDGQPIILARTAQYDLTTEGTVQLDVWIDNPSSGSILHGIVSLQIADVSVTPPGTPTFRVNSPGGFINEGDTVNITLQTENIAPGTTCTVQIVNTAAAAADWIEANHDQWAAACAAANCTYTIRTTSSGLITFGSGYSDANPIHYTRTSKADSLTEASSEQVDWIFANFSDPTMRIYSSAVSYWLIDTSQNPTPPAFQIKMSPSNPNPGDTITYTLKSETGATGGRTVVFAQGGDASDADFNISLDDLLTNLAATESANLSYDTSTNTLTVSASWTGTSSTTRILNPATTATKHTMSLTSAGGGAILVVADDVCYIGGSGAVTPFTYASGINLSGADFGAFLINSNTVLDYYATKDFHISRFPVKWEYLQSTAFGSLNSTNTNAFIAMVKYWTNTKGRFAIVDLHSYSKLNNVQIGITGSLVRPQALCDLWVKLVNAMQAASVDMSKVILDLMNEPTNLAADWRRYAQAATNAIRARTTFTGMIMVEGVSGSSAMNWSANKNDSELVKFYDPANNYAFQPHQYLDSNGSGTLGSCAVNSASRISSITNWARTNGKKLFLGEIAWGDDSIAGNEQCGVEYPQIMTRLTVSDADVWIGYTYWGAGQFWAAGYPFKLDPSAYDGSVPDTQQMYELLLYNRFTA